MWILPPGPWDVSLPDGFLLLPHHYTAADRDLLLELLRCAAPECAPLLIEAASLDGLLERGVTWTEGVALLHGFEEGADIDALRAKVARLGARHSLVQLPKPQLTGTSWLEPVLKVPLLRALERAWRNPEHPLRNAGIAEMPLREAAQYTDDPVEFLAIVRAAVEHRLRSVAVGVGASDWGRSLDHALADRLILRSGDSSLLRGLTFSNDSKAVSEMSADTAHALARCGLISIEGASFRSTPILGALARPLTRVFATNTNGELSAVFSQRSRDLFHMALEAAVLEVRLKADVFDEVSGLTRTLLAEEHGIVGLSNTSLRTARAIPLVAHHNEWISPTILRLRSLPSTASAAARKTAHAIALYLAATLAAGPDAGAELSASIVELEQLRLRSKWRSQAIDVLRVLLLLRTWVTRSSADEMRRIGVPLIAQVPEGQDARRLIESLLVGPPYDQERFGQEKDLFAISGATSNTLASEPPETLWNRPIELGQRVTPGRLWWAVARQRAPEVVHAARTIGSRSAGVDNLTVRDLHCDLVVGIAALSVGDLDLAAERGRLVLDLATRYEIPVHRAFARELLAAVHELHGEYDEAAKLLFQARSRYRALEDKPRIEGVEKRLARMGITFEPVGSTPRTPKRSRRR